VAVRARSVAAEDSAIGGGTAARFSGCGHEIGSTTFEPGLVGGSARLLLVRLLGRMTEPTLEQRYADARDAYLIDFGLRWTRRKPFIFGVHQLLVLALMLTAGSADWRFYALVAVYATMSTLGVIDAVRLKAGPRAKNQIAFSTAISMFLTFVGCAFSGGHASPLLPITLVAVVVPAAAYGRRPHTWLLFAELLICLVIVSALPPSVVGPHLPHPWLWIGMTGSIVFAVWISVTNLVLLTEVYARAALHAARMRDELLEAHDARTRSLESIGARVAHELKNPLAAIAGLVQLLLESPQEAKTRERLGVIGSEVGRMEKVIHDYLAFSRPLDEMRPRETDLTALIAGLLDVLEARASRRGVSLASDGPRLRAHVDPDRLKEALLNLVDNAIEASPAGTEVVVVLASEEPPTCARSRIVIEVRDRGEGIAPDALARLGTPYFTTRPQGTGLGVALARATVLQHGGTLDYESELGRGTVARIALPAAEAKAA
jgi:signal transduction histidine kinase